MWVISTGVCSFPSFSAGTYNFSLAVSNFSGSLTNSAVGYVYVTPAVQFATPFATQRVFTGLPAGTNTLYTVFDNSRTTSGAPNIQCFGYTTVHFSPNLLP